MEHLGNASLVLRSQTTLFASTFHALMHPSEVPIKSFNQEEILNKKNLQYHANNTMK